MRAGAFEHYDEMVRAAFIFRFIVIFLLHIHSANTAYTMRAQGKSHRTIPGRYISLEIRSSITR